MFTFLGARTQFSGKLIDITLLSGQRNSTYCLALVTWIRFVTRLPTLGQQNFVSSTKSQSNKNRINFSSPKYWEKNKHEIFGYPSELNHRKQTITPLPVFENGQIKNQQFFWLLTVSFPLIPFENFDAATWGTKHFTKTQILARDQWELNIPNIAQIDHHNVSWFFNPISRTNQKWTKKKLYPTPDVSDNTTPNLKRNYCKIEPIRFFAQKTKVEQGTRNFQNSSQNKFRKPSLTFFFRGFISWPTKLFWRYWTLPFINVSWNQT